MRAFVLRLSLVALALSFSGCPSFDELPPCQRKSVACKNSCFKAGAADACSQCCVEAEDACTAGRIYSFFWCPNK
jgi:hypothetical protein